MLEGFRTVHRLAKNRFRGTEWNAAEELEEEHQTASRNCKIIREICQLISEHLLKYIKTVKISVVLEEEELEKKRLQQTWLATINAEKLLCQASARGKTWIRQQLTT